MIRKDMLNRDITVCFTDMNSRRIFCYPVDAFYEWLKANTTVLQTESWTQKNAKEKGEEKVGLYNWPYVPEKYFDFLDDWERDCFPEDISVSEERRFSDERIEDLKYFKRKYGHCYVYDTPDVVSDEEEKRRLKGLKAWVNKKRKEYYNFRLVDPYGAGASEQNMDHLLDDEPIMDEKEVAELTNIGFIFYPNLEFYFRTPNYHDRQHLIDILQELQTPETE